MTEWIVCGVVVGLFALPALIKKCVSDAAPVVPAKIQYVPPVPEKPTPRILDFGIEGKVDNGLHGGNIGVTMRPKLTIREDVSMVDQAEIRLHNYSEDHTRTILWSSFIKACPDPARCLGSRHDRQAMLVDSPERTELAPSETKVVTLKWRYFRSPNGYIPTSKMHYSFGCYVAPKDCIAFAKRIGDDTYAKQAAAQARP